MTAPVKKPCFIAGAVRTSGDPQTGEVPFTRGGMRTSTVWSGSLLTNTALTGAAGAVQSGGQVLLVSGAGRLNSVVPHQFLQSGQPVWFYDAGTITVSGISVSGQRIIGIIPGTSPANPTVQSGQFQMARTWSDVIFVDMPFSSGLCVGAASGTPGFTVSYTLETSEPAYGIQG